jgi:rod shape-determining protein MreC
VGQAVVSQGHLVGKVILANESSSTVLLITNAQSSVDAKLSKSGVEGIVKGSFGSGLFFDLVSQNTEINPGDLIVTAGIDSRVPKNILIGEAGDLLSNNNDLFKKRSVTSPIAFHDLDFVFVVK